MTATHSLSVRQIGASLTLLAAMTAMGASAVAQIGTGVYRNVSGSVTREYGNDSLGGSITAHASGVVFDSRIAPTYDYARATVRAGARILILDRELDMAETTAVANVRGSGVHGASVRREFFDMAVAERSAASGRVALDASLTLSRTYRKDIQLIGPVHIEIRAVGQLNLGCGAAANADGASRVAAADGRIRTWANGTATGSLSVYVADAGLEVRGRFADQTLRAAVGAELRGMPSGSAGWSMTAIDLKLRAFARVRKFWTWTPWEWASESRTLTNYRRDAESRTWF